MTKRKIKDLPTLTSASEIDVIPIVDVDEPVLENQTKKISIGNLLNGLTPTVATGGRVQLTEDTTFYVDRATGNDANSGRTLNDRWKTIVYALGYIGGLDLNDFHVTLEIEYGNYVDEGLLHLPLLVGAASETYILGGIEDPFGPPGQGDPVINTHLDIGPTGFKDGNSGKDTLILPPIEVDHFGYYSINNATIQISGPGVFIA